MWSTTEEEKNELCRTIATYDAPRVLEIGAFKGETTRALVEAAARRGGYVVVIDPMRWAAEFVANGIARHLPRKLSLLTGAVETLLGEASYEAAFWQRVGELRPHVLLHRALSNAPEVVEGAAPELQRFDVVFIDGDHSHQGASDDLWTWGRRTVVGGTILVHDATDRFPGVLSALRGFAEAHGVHVGPPAVGSLASIRVSRAFAAVRSRSAALEPTRAAPEPAE